MSIQIDQSKILPQLKTWAEGRRRVYEDNSVDLGRETLDVAQEWFDLEPWIDGKPEHYDTKRECRIELKRFILARIRSNFFNSSSYNASKLTQFETPRYESCCHFLNLQNIKNYLSFITYLDVVSSKLNQLLNEKASY